MDSLIHFFSVATLKTIKLFHWLLLGPALKFCVWYIIYSTVRILLKVALKLRYEVYNESLKLKRSEQANRLILVTGATSGIGLALTHHLVESGFPVIACFYSKQEPGYRQIEELIEEKGSKSKPIVKLVELNVRSADSIRRCREEVNETLEANPDLGLHALVNVAGVAYMHKVQWMPDEYTRNVVETNLLGPMRMVKQFLPQLIRAPNSRIVNVASAIAFIPTPFNAAYCATKAGLTHYTNSIEIDLQKYGLKTVTIHPGNVIRNTSILTTSIGDGLETIVAQLTDEELELYSEELEIHKREMSIVSKLQRKPGSLDLKWSSRFSTNAKRILARSTGCAVGDELQFTTFINSFDNAIRMFSPPREMFAGNRYFDTVIGSIIEIVGHSTRRDLGIALAKSAINILK